MWKMIEVGKTNHAIINSESTIIAVFSNAQLEQWKNLMSDANALMVLGEHLGGTDQGELFSDSL